VVAIDEEHHEAFSKHQTLTVQGREFGVVYLLSIGFTKIDSKEFKIAIYFVSSELIRELIQG